jgi:hypothetical protein
MRLRLRPAHDAETLARIYPKPHDSSRYGRGTKMRVEMTIGFAQAVWPDVETLLVADLMCGDGKIASNLGLTPILGDIAPGYPITGPIEMTIGGLTGSVDLFVLSEALEHLDEPLVVLHSIREWSERLLITTPLGAYNDLWENPEHYWAWDRQGVEELFALAGWTVQAFASLDTRPLGEPYHYGMWALQ